MQLLLLWPLEINHFNSNHFNSIEPKLNLEFTLILPVNTVFNSVASFVDLTVAIPTSPHSHCAIPLTYTAHRSPPSSPTASSNQHWAAPLPGTSDQLLLSQIPQVLSYCATTQVLLLMLTFLISPIMVFFLFLKPSMFMQFSELCKSWIYPLRLFFLLQTWHMDCVHDSSHKQNNTTSCLPCVTCRH